ncbi:MAG: penicillin-binding protein 1C, partial [Pseudomonas helleri]
MLKKIVLWSTCGLLLAVALLWLADRLWPLPLPKDDLARVVLAEDGTPLWRFADANGVWRYPVQTDEVSPYYLEALLTYEDRWFYQHPGVNPLALGRAAWQNLSGGRVLSGGSTLSMQVARLLDPHERTLPGKLRQLWRTAQLEWHLSKSEILNLYLNRAPFGGTLQGVAAASWAYLGKSPQQLTRSEAALLAVLPQAPSRLRPDRHPERAQVARDKVLRRLAEYQVWPQGAVDEALEEPLLLAPRLEPSLAPLLARRLNRPHSPPLIRTTLDANLQRRLEDLLLGWRARLPEHTSAAILVVETDNMAVRAYLGSVDINDARRFGHVDMISALRSPGSTLKPFLYGMAMDAGLIHSESLLQDVPRRYGDYRPGNFSMGFSGPVSASSALALSLNLPAVQLLEAYGPKRFAADLRNGGVPLSLPALAEPNLALILGGAGSRLEDLVSGYSALARGGKSANLRLQPQDELLERRMLSPGSAWIIRRIL